MKLKPKEKETLQTEEYEICVICGKLTFVPISMPIERRENYIIGCGQICSECAKKQLIK
jgi:hypothetical protein